MADGTERTAPAVADIKLYTLSATASKVDIVNVPNGARSGAIEFFTNAGVVALGSGASSFAITDTMVKGTDDCWALAADSGYTFPCSGGSDVYVASATVSTKYTIVFYSEEYRG